MEIKKIMRNLGFFKYLIYKESDINENGNCLLLKAPRQHKNAD